MEIVHTIQEIREKIKKVKLSDQKVGFVPTMGFLHQGHLGLVEISKKETQYQVMSIFVNKTQFNDPKDFDSYPKDLKRDFELAEGVGVDLVFVPDDSEMYQNNLVYVDINDLTETLCGATRPGHYRGVLTVVSKLFNIVQPDVSVFGQKDIQQAICIEKMINDLNFPTKMIIAPIKREEDGLAMSSRNKLLKKDERKNSVSIYNSLKLAEDLLKKGERNCPKIVDQIEKILKENNCGKIDYISFVDYEALSEIKTIAAKCILAVAVFFGQPRLIDNMVIDFDGGDVRCTY